MTCWLAISLIYCAWVIHLIAKPKPKLKPKSKTEVHLWLYCTFHHQKKDRLKQGVCLFPNSDFCKVHLVAVWTAAYVTLFTALIPGPCVDEECWNVDCVSSVFRTATLRTHNYYICRYVRSICIFISMLFRKDVVALKIMGMERGGILICYLFSWFICNNKRNALIM